MEYKIALLLKTHYRDFCEEEIWKPCSAGSHFFPK